MAEFLTFAHAASEVMMHLVTHAAHGYSQPNREGDGTTETIRLTDGTKVKVHGGDYDCSKANITSYECLGVNCGGATYTGDMINCMVYRAATFGFVSLSDARDGDILLKDGHTEMLVVVDGRRYQAGFRASENHSITGKTGDQTGWESTYSAYKPSAWTWCLRYRGPKRKPVQSAGSAVNDAGLRYRAHVQAAGWLPSVHDGQTAGTTGQSARLEAIKITPPEGVTLDVQAHIQKRGNIRYTGICKGKSSGIGSSDNDPIIGTINLGLRLEGIWIKAVKIPEGKSLMYRAHVQSAGWLPWQTAGTKDYGGLAGTTGQSRRMEAVQMKIV